MSKHKEKWLLFLNLNENNLLQHSCFNFSKLWQHTSYWQVWQEGEELLISYWWYKFLGVRNQNCPCSLCWKRIWWLNHKQVTDSSREHYLVIWSIWVGMTKTSLLIAHLVVFYIALPFGFFALCRTDKGIRFQWKFLLCNVSLNMFFQGCCIKLDVKLKVVMIRK